jgi:RNA polymerase sigma-70 factor (ECF subfamily)
VAWNCFVELYEPLVQYWCRRAGLAPDSAADIWQEVLLAVSKHIGTFERRGRGSFRSWLRSIARSKICDEQRRGAPRAEGGSDAQERLAQVPTVEDAAAEVVDEETSLLYRQALQVILRDFEPTTAQAFLRVVVEGEAPCEVAQTLNLTPNAVYLAQARVLKRLREEFRELIDG